MQEDRLPLAKHGHKTMRADKFLWHVRLFKTRSLASEACRKNQVTINGTSVKASREIKPGDRIRLRRHQVFFEFLVLGEPRSRVGARLVPQYLKNITPPEEIERMELLRLSRTTYVNAYREGRPTKKDRRDMEDFTEDWLDLLEQDDAEPTQQPSETTAL